MPVILPLLPDIPFQEVDIALDGTVYRFNFQWAERESIWYMDISTIDDDLIQGGIRLVLGTYLGWRVTDPDYPAGLLRLFDNSHSGQEARLDDLGTRVVMHYYSQDELGI